MDGLKRGDIVIAVLSGDYGKPRPAVVVQTNVTLSSHASVTVCPVTSTIMDAPLFRVPLGKGEETGLEKDSQIMIDKIVTIKKERIKSVLGRVSQDDLVKVGRSIAFWLEL